MLILLSSSIGSGRVRAVDYKHKAFGVSLHNRYNALVELNTDMKGADSVLCDDDNVSTEQGIVFCEEEIVLDKGRCESDIANQPCEVSKLFKRH